jgi:hypothetical protein
MLTFITLKRRTPDYIFIWLKPSAFRAERPSVSALCKPFIITLNDAR